MAVAYKNLLLVYDVPGWAWHRRAQDLQTFAPPEYDVTIRSDEEFAAECRVDPNYPASFDAVFSFNWPGCNLRMFAPARRLVGLITSSGHLYAEATEDNWDSWIVTRLRNSRTAAERMPKFDALIAVNRKIAEAARQYNENIHLIPSPVNDEFFKLGPFWFDVSKSLRVGWCANPGGKRSVKGYNKVLVALMDQLTDGIEWMVNARDWKSALTREEMVEWYQGIDVFLVTSINDGTPSPPFEAASCGAVIVSTDVGCIADWEMPHKLSLVAPAYHNAKTRDVTVKQLARILRRLRDNKWALPSTALKLRQSIRREYSYRILAPKYLGVIAGDLSCTEFWSSMTCRSGPSIAMR